MNTSTTTLVTKEANKHLSEYEYGRLVGTFLYKGNFAQISRDLDLPESTVRSAYKRFQKTQTTLPKTSTGRKRLLSQTDLNAISQSVRRRLTESIRAQHRRFLGSGKKVSLSAFRDALTRMKFKSRIAA